MQIQCGKMTVCRYRRWSQCWQVLTNCKWNIQFSYNPHHLLLSRPYEFDQNESTVLFTVTSEDLSFNKHKLDRRTCSCFDEHLQTQDAFPHRATPIWTPCDEFLFILVTTCKMCDLHIELCRPAACQEAAPADRSRFGQLSDPPFNHPTLSLIDEKAFHNWTLCKHRQSWSSKGKTWAWMQLLMWQLHREIFPNINTRFQSEPGWKAGRKWNWDWSSEVQ